MTYPCHLEVCVLVYVRCMNNVCGCIWCSACVVMCIHIWGTEVNRDYWCYHHQAHNKATLSFSTSFPWDRISPCPWARQKWANPGNLPVLPSLPNQCWGYRCEQSQLTFMWGLKLGFSCLCSFSGCSHPLHHLHIVLQTRGEMALTCGASASASWPATVSVLAHWAWGWNITVQSFILHRQMSSMGQKTLFHWLFLLACCRY